MDKDAFEVFKNLKSDNDLRWLKDMLIVEYGVIETVFDANTVRARILVQADTAPKLYTVRLLKANSSRLREEVVQPQVHDQVLLLFIRTHHDDMFLDPEERARVNNGNPTVRTEEVSRYTMYSGVGILAATAKNRAPTITHYGEDSSGPYTTHQTRARVSAAFKRMVSLVFDVPKANSGDTPADQPVNVLFGRHSPFKVEHRAAVAATVRKDATIDVTLEDGATVTLTSKDGAGLTLDKSFSLKADGGIGLDAGKDKLELKNGAGNLKTGLDGALTDCSSLVSALNAFSGPAAQAAVSAGGTTAAVLAAALVTLMASLSSALATLGFTTDKTNIDNVLK